MRPVVVSAPLDELPHKLASLAPNVCFDSIVGRNVLAGELDKTAVVQQLLQLLHPNGTKISHKGATRFGEVG
jgi:putative ATPase